MVKRAIEAGAGPEQFERIIAELAGVADDEYYWSPLEEWPKHRLVTRLARDVQGRLFVHAVSQLLAAESEHRQMLEDYAAQIAEEQREGRAAPQGVDLLRLALDPDRFGSISARKVVLRKIIGFLLRPETHLDDAALDHIAEHMLASPQVFEDVSDDQLMRVLEGRKTGPLPRHVGELLELRLLYFSYLAQGPQPSQRMTRAARLLGTWLAPMVPGEAWSDDAIAFLNRLRGSAREAWIAALEHAGRATSATPSGKWIKRARELVAEIGVEKFLGEVRRWFSLLAEPRPVPPAQYGIRQPGAEYKVADRNADVLRGLVWCCGDQADAEMCREIAALCKEALRKIPQTGPRCPKLANACIYVVGQTDNDDARGQLARLRARVTHRPTRAQIDKALDAAAGRAGLTREQLEEMAVPTYGLEEVGRLRQRLGDWTAELGMTGTSSTELRWLKPDGKPQKSVPATVKKEFSDELKELKAAAKDIEKLLPAERDRLDALMLSRRSWPIAYWREHYLDHPLVGTLARRLIWEFESGDREEAGIWNDGRVTGLDDRPLGWLGDEATVQLWHPIDHAPETVLAWREVLEKHEIRQPFKQAHREVYLLTDAERQTRVYSNRFAAHILRQHQFNVLAAARGWKYRMTGAWDNPELPASRDLPQDDLRVQFWTDPAGEPGPGYTNDAGIFLYVTTDQVRFYRLSEEEADPAARYHRANGRAQPVPLEEIPRLVFSEMMRDVDLFVGVASVGNDPAWSEGGPEGRYRDYWQSYSFGDLSASAKTRQEFLERLLPRLKIAPRCSIRDKFLVVKGDLRTYKIHLGSGNILMEPNDQYLCIVADRRTKPAASPEKVFLPFEGDGTLSLILSKAFLLADDKKISDPSILRQIKP